MCSVQSLLVFLLVSTSLLMGAQAGRGKMDPEMQKMAQDIQAKMCTAKPEQIAKADTCDADSKVMYLLRKKIAC